MSETALVKQSYGAIDTPTVPLFTEEEKQILIANKIIPASANNMQIKYFFEVCKRKHLDPFLKQVHMIERRESDKKGGWITSYTIQASLDGMRAIVQRTCKVESYKRWTEYRDIGGGERELYGCCEIKTSDRGTYYDELPFKEYVQKTKEGYITHFWKQFPETMIKKCAEESVDRMVAPEDLSNIYGDDEMMQADKPVKEVLPKQEASFEDILNEANNLHPLPKAPQDPVVLPQTPEQEKEWDDLMKGKKDTKKASKKQITALYAVNGDVGAFERPELIQFSEKIIGHAIEPDEKGEKHLSSMTSGEVSTVIDALQTGNWKAPMIQPTRKGITDKLLELTNGDAPRASRIFYNVTGYFKTADIPDTNVVAVFKQIEALTPDMAIIIDTQ